MMTRFSSLLLTTTGRRRSAPALAARWAVLLLLLLLPTAPLLAPLGALAQAPASGGFTPGTGPVGTSAASFATDNYWMSPPASTTCSGIGKNGPVRRTSAPWFSG